jgi:nucleoid DNA-binding protein
VGGLSTLRDKLRKEGDIMAKNINKDALVDEISTKTELSKKDVEMVLDSMVEAVTKNLKEGNKVTLTGFGTFRVSKRAARVGINPQTKAKIQIPAMSVPKFTAGKALKETIR